MVQSPPFLELNRLEHQRQQLEAFFDVAIFFFEAPTMK